MMYLGLVVMLHAFLIVAIDAKDQLYAVNALQSGE
jgi:hypothetical protein